MPESLIAVLAAIVLVTPEDGAEMNLLPEIQRRMMSIPTAEGRLSAVTAEYRRLHPDDYGGPSASRADRRESADWFATDAEWRKYVTPHFVWRLTEGETGPWKIEISKTRDFACPVVGYTRKKPIAGKVGFGFSYANLEIGTEYFWRVSSEGKMSEVGVFRTEGRAPRWIRLEGRTKNVRDLGGWKTSDGKRVRQGLAFRGEGLNDDSETGETPGRNRLFVEDVRFMKGVLGIKTDLDLRAPKALAGMSASPLGGGVSLVAHSSPSYRTIFLEEGKKVMAENFRIFCDRKNYPIYFHCIHGADRTGALAYVLNGTLGVSRNDLELDWESTFYPGIPGYCLKKADGGKYDRLEDGTKVVWNDARFFDEGFRRYGDDSSTWNERIVLYLRSCGITDEEIRRFREIMLESE